ncbi:secretion system protein, partial [Methanosarcinales archaeon]
LILAYLIINVFGIPDNFTNLHLPQSLLWMNAHVETLLTIFLFFFTAMIFSATVYVFFYIYPSLVAGGKKAEINKMLPHGIRFMYALSKGGANIIEILRALARNEDTYGEISKEAEAIIKYIDFLGYDLREALLHAGEETPSDNFRELIDGLLTIIDSGGDMTRFLSDKTIEYMQIAKIEQKGFLETLALMAESYVTAFVAGPLFIIIIEVVMTLMGSGQMMALYAIIYMVIPVGSLMFVMMIYLISPSDITNAPILKTEFSYDAEDVEIEDVDPEDVEAYTQYKKSKKTYALKEMLKHPLKPFKENPILVLAVSGPLALITVIAGVGMNFDDFRMDPVGVIDDYLVLAAFVMFLPLVIFYEAKRRRHKKIKSQVPNFLKGVASTNASGMTLTQSIEVIAKSTSGAIGEDIARMWRDLEWGISVRDAFVRFANRVKMASLSRTVTLLTETMRTSGEVADTLYLSAKDTEMAEELDRERFTNMLIYIIIIYIAFFVFIGIIFIISTSFLPVMASAGKDVASSGMSAEGFLGEFDIDLFKRIFLHASLLQGFCSGLIAGQMGEGEFLAGFKHSLIMVLIAYIAFTVFI